MSVVQTDRADSADARPPLSPADSRRHSQIAEIQRGRMVDAAVATAAEMGVRNLTVAHVVSRAGVSRRTFYEAFDDCEDCVLAAFDDTAKRAEQRIAQAMVGCSEGRWLQRVRTALFAFLRFMDEDPDSGRFLVVESLGADPRTLARRQQLNARLVAAVDRVREEGRRAQNAPLLAAEGTVGAVMAVLRTRMLEDRRSPFVELLGPLMSMIVLPYLGMAAAQRELEERRVPVAPRARRESAGSLGKLDLRLTYRTVRVLAAVANSPGSSNRAIGSSAGISDQGQASKLLRRLQRLGLVENVPKEPLRGEPNSWTLTAKGWQVHGALRTQGSSA